VYYNFYVGRATNTYLHHIMSGKVIKKKFDQSLDHEGKSSKNLFLVIKSQMKANQ